MAERATFCPVCIGMRIGIHGRNHAQEKSSGSDICGHAGRSDPSPSEMVGHVPDALASGYDAPVAETPKADSEAGNLSEIPGVMRGSELSAKPKFDKTAYQREYMRKLRAKKRKP